MSDDDRRGQQRVTVNEEFSSIGGFLSEYVSNLSRGGIFLRCDEVLELGTEVDLHFTILVDDMETIQGRGVVVHHGHGGPPGLGIRFLELSPASLAIIEDLYERQLIGE